jgi:anti-sigma factor RsiW
MEQVAAGIEEHWLNLKATGEAIVEQALKGQKAAAADLAKFWRTADAIDEHLDEMIEAAAHPQS